MVAVLALAGGRLIEALLYGIRPDDPGVLVIAAVALFAFAIVACWLPARRAARIDPAEALRAD
jgi:ABC-type lipoprotein release transport system permease subunit